MHCNYFKSSRCGSCNLLDTSYENSLRIKEVTLKKLFPEHIDLIKPTIGIDGEVSQSRNKAKFAVSLQAGEVVFGFFRQDGSHQELENCPLHASGINALLPIIRDKLNKHRIIPYDLLSKNGELKYLIISATDSPQSPEFLLRFVLRSKESLHRLKKVSLELQALQPSIKVVTANIQPIHQAILEGDEEIVLTENSVIMHQFDEFELALGARSFFQVTPVIAKSLYNAVSEQIAIDKPDSLIDLYCGVGAFSFYASRHCANITGIEISSEAIACAKLSAEKNNLPIHFEAIDVEKYLEKSKQKYSAVIINPPRRGLNLEIINHIRDISPQNIYYSSCNAHTLARDFHELRNNYEIVSMQIFDMFPYTSHFETLLCLKRKINN